MYLCEKNVNGIKTNPHIIGEVLLNILPCAESSRITDDYWNFLGFAADRRKIKEQDTNGRMGRPLELPEEKRAKMTDNGNGMKVVAILITAAVAIFVISLVAVYIADSKVHPSLNSAAYPGAKVN